MNPFRGCCQLVRFLAVPNLSVSWQFATCPFRGGSQLAGPFRGSSQLVHFMAVSNVSVSWRFRSCPFRGRSVGRLVGQNANSFSCQTLVHAGPTPSLTIRRSVLPISFLRFGMYTQRKHINNNSSSHTLLHMLLCILVYCIHRHTHNIRISCICALNTQQPLRIIRCCN